jgi:hypothetical protein
MYRIFILALIAVLSGCSGTTMVRSSYSQPEKIVQAERWEPIMEDSKINVDVNYQYEMKLSNGRLLRQGDWNESLKPFVSSYSQEKADTIIDGLTRYYWEYDKVDKKIKYEPLRYMSEPYSNSKYVSMQGSIEKGKAVGLLKLKFYGSSWIFADSVKIVADDLTWQSPKMNFYRDNYGGNVWEYAYLDISKPEYRDIANKIASSKEVIIRFQGKQYYSDLTLSQRMKSDLMAMLKAIDVVNQK